jgi:hypothetical protein
VTTAEIEHALRARDCALVADGGRFALVYPHGYEQRKRAHDLAAADRAGALAEAWAWLHPDATEATGIATVQAVVAADFGVTVEALPSRDRSEPLATARRVAMAIARELTGATFARVGEQFARDHGTVIHAVESVRDQCTTETAFAARVGTLRAVCRAALAPLQP